MMKAWVYEVFALVQRLPGGVDAVEPAAVLGVVEMPLQRAEQRGGAFFGKGCAGFADQAGEQVQLPGAGHGAVALRRQRPVVGVQRLVGQRQLGVPARALPERHDQVMEVREHGIQGRLKGGAWSDGHWLASSRQGCRRAW